MSLDDYIEFKSDVTEHLNEMIIRYNLHFNGVLPIERIEDPNLYLYLENKNCRIGLNSVETFPYEDVMCHFYLLDANKNEIYIGHKFLNFFLGIDEKEYHRYALDHYDSNINIDFGHKQERGGFLRGIIAINDAIKKYYYPLFDGTYTYKMYEKWLGYVKANYDISDKKTSLPSYSDIRNELMV